eukprot:m.281277 g.281277  ORF g.281277 m.281277 type:complete len:273 (+) comp16331_c0_seq2:584-1402(+)
MDALSAVKNKSVEVHRRWLDDKPMKIPKRKMKDLKDLVKKVKIHLNHFDDLFTTHDSGSIYIRYTAKITFSDPKQSEEESMKMINDIKDIATQMMHILQPEKFNARVNHDNIAFGVEHHNGFCLVKVSVHCVEINGEHAELKNETHRQIIESIEVSKHFTLWRLKALEKNLGALNEAMKQIYEHGSRDSDTYSDTSETLTCQSSATSHEATATSKLVVDDTTEEANHPIDTHLSWAESGVTLLSPLFFVLFLSVVSFFFIFYFLAPSSTKTT